MKIEIDTSSRLDQSGNTIFSFSNEESKTILLSQKVRDKILTFLPEKRIIKQVKLFTICCFLLIKDSLEKIEEIKIDLEYPKYEGFIRDYLLKLIKKHLKRFFAKEKIKIVSIGKKSKVHQIAWRARKKEKKPDKILTFKEILKILLK
jgi:hypothetical protein